RNRRRRDLDTAGKIALRRYSLTRHALRALPTSPVPGEGSDATSLARVTKWRERGLWPSPHSFAKYTPAFLKLSLVDLAAGEPLLENVEQRLGRRQMRRMNMRARACPPCQHHDQGDQGRDED